MIETAVEAPVQRSAGRIRPGVPAATLRNSPTSARRMRLVASAGRGRRHTGLTGESTAVSRNVRMMRLLARIAARFNEAGIPLMALKGAALNLTIYERADERPMGDLDLLIPSAFVGEARAVLEALDCRRGESLVRADFFPRFYYETEYTAGEVYPVKIDLHVRPFRPLRYARLVPNHALWRRARTVRIDGADIYVPSAEEMLIHLAVHAAVHGDSRPMWRQDIKRWIDAHRAEIRWDVFLYTVGRWRLALPVRRGLAGVERELGTVCPPDVTKRLMQKRVTWRDRLVLWHAPRDANRPVTHTLVDVMCTPGWRFCLGYLWAILLPEREHMQAWYGRRHRGCLAAAHALRWIWPVAKHVFPSRARPPATPPQTRATRTQPGGGSVTKATEERPRWSGTGHRTMTSRSRAPLFPSL